MSRSVFPIAAGLLWAAMAALSQTTANAPVFEVASIKPAPPFTPGARNWTQAHVGVRIDKAQADFGGMPLRELVARAYRVKSFQVSGPDENLLSRWDILAKMPEGASEDQVPEMLKALLIERFQLKAHQESKEFPVYALVVGKGGAKLTPKPADYDPSVRSNVRPLTLESYASLLSTTVDRQVLDFTEMKGDYMLSLEPIITAMGNRMRSQVARQAAVNSGGSQAEAASDPDSAIFAAVQSQGLKLEPRKVNLPAIVVEHVQKSPVDN